MNFTERIKTLRTKAQESQAANKIIDMLKDLESKNDDITAYRWVWELIQNAKDVPNSTGKVDIIISFDEANKKLEFKHNGRLFATKNIIFLIEQVSTKERGKIENKEEKTTGKFGTGFLTTHLLSKKVNVSGYIQDENEPISKFSIDLDRTSEEQKEIISSIENSCNQLEQNSCEVTNEIDERNFNTCFTYKLDCYGVKVANEGIKNLLDTAPYIFAFVSQLNSITINTNENKQIIRRIKEMPIRLENSKVVKTCVSTNNIEQNKYILLKYNTDMSVEIAVEVEPTNDGKKICPLKYNLPKLYCDFPLLGTNDFAFPIAINCRAFNPTEPRNGIFLTSKDGRKDTDDVELNKKNIKEAVELYIHLLDYFVKNQYMGIYNIVKIKEQPLKDWVSLDWINENVINRLKESICNQPLVKTVSGKYCSIGECSEENNLLLPTDENKEARTKLWELTAKIYPNRTPQKEEFEDWYNSLWEECHNFTISYLIDVLASFEALDTLSKNVGTDCYKWLKSFYELIFNRDYGVKQEYIDKEIIPNQDGKFCSIANLEIIEGVEEEYYEIAKILNIDLKNQMVDDKVAIFKTILNQCKKYDFDNLCDDFRNKLKSYYIQNEDDFYRNILRLKANSDYSKFLSLAKDFYEDDWDAINVNKTSEALSKEALEFWIKKLIDQISNLGTVKNLADHLGYVNCNDAIKWLNKAFNCLNTFKKLSLINSEDIFPMQNGELRSASEVYVDTGEVAEETKDVLSLIGKDIRCELICRNFSWRPCKVKKKTNEEIATPIINYIKDNQKKLGTTLEEKAIFHNFYRYLRANEQNDDIKNVFALLYSNLHWFYNDEDIAINMQKVEEYDSVLKKYGVNDIVQLENILSNSKSYNRQSIEITSDLLAQWGITTEEELNKALQNNLLGDNFIYLPEKDQGKFNYVQQILKRAKENIIKFLAKLEDYDVSSPIQIAKTVFLIKKNGEEIYIIPRPSDYEQVVIYYNSELDMLDYEKDCELWVENGKDDPKKITFGKILKLTGVNKIPLKEIRRG